MGVIQLLWEASFTPLALQPWPCWALGSSTPTLSTLDYDWV